MSTLTLGEGAIKGDLVDGVPAAPERSEVCAYCGAHYAEGPEGAVDATTGVGWQPGFHCWRCGYDPNKLAGGGAPVALPAFGPGLSNQFAQQLAAQVHAALGLPEGTNLGDLIRQVQEAAAKAPEVTS